MQVMDTTLRDGEQTPGVNYTPDEKLVIAEALLRSGVDAIEVASAKISEGEALAVQRITNWARSRDLLNRIEILGFVDGTSSVDWIVQNGGRVINLLAKGSEHHCRVQLKKSPNSIFRILPERCDTRSNAVSPSTYTRKTGLRGCATPQNM